MEGALCEKVKQEISKVTNNTLEKLDRSPRATKGYKGIAMEGVIARWYAQNTKQGRDFPILAKRIAGQLAAGAHVLEVAPGPGYLSVEIAKLGNYEVAGLDISRTFVEIAQANVRAAGVKVEFRQGNAADLPFDDNTFDFIVCTAAFKNFTEPVRALREMYRVLKPGGKALVLDLRRDASVSAIDAEVDGMGLNAINKFMTKWTFRQMLLKSAYTIGEMRTFIEPAGFTKYQIPESGIGFEAWMER
jgi:ubiquinone/menaquinone biosynthesis C-methylase UbiE